MQGLVAKSDADIALRRFIGQISLQLKKSWMVCGEPAKFTLSMFHDDMPETTMVCSRRTVGKLTFQAGNITKVIDYHQYNFQTECYNVCQQLWKAQ